MFLSCFTSGRAQPLGCAPPVAAPDVRSNTRGQVDVLALLAQLAQLGGLATPQGPLSKVTNSGSETPTSLSPARASSDEPSNRRRVTLPATSLSLEFASFHGSTEGLQLPNSGRPSLNPSELVAPLTAAGEPRQIRQGAAQMSSPQPAKPGSATVTGGHGPGALLSRPQPAKARSATCEGGHGPGALLPRPQPAKARSATYTGGHVPVAHPSHPQPAKPGLATVTGGLGPAVARATTCVGGHTHAAAFQALEAVSALRKSSFHTSHAPRVPQSARSAGLPPAIRPRSSRPGSYSHVPSVHAPSRMSPQLKLDNSGLRL